MSPKHRFEIPKIGEKPRSRDGFARDSLLQRRVSNELFWRWASANGVRRLVVKPPTKWHMSTYNREIAGGNGACTGAVEPDGRAGIYLNNEIGAVLEGMRQ